MNNRQLTKLLTNRAARTFLDNNVFKFCILMSPSARLFTNRLAPKFQSRSQGLFLFQGALKFPENNVSPPQDRCPIKSVSRFLARNVIKSRHRFPSKFPSNSVTPFPKSTARVFQNKYRERSAIGTAAASAVAASARAVDLADKKCDLSGEDKIIIYLSWAFGNPLFIICN